MSGMQSKSRHFRHVWLSGVGQTTCCTRYKLPSCIMAVVSLKGSWGGFARGNNLPNSRCGSCELVRLQEAGVGRCLLRH